MEEWSLVMGGADSVLGRRRKMKSQLSGKRTEVRIVRLILIAVVFLIFVFPDYWVIVTSLDAPNQVMRVPPLLIPQGHWGNYSIAWRGAPWLRYFANTFFIAGLTTLLVLVTSVLAGFAFGVLRFRGRSFLFSVVLSMMMIPLAVLLVPDYIILKQLHWLNTYWAQIMPFGASVFGIFLFRQFFMSFPLELIDAAEIDGASQWRFIWRVAVPMARPVLTTVAIFTFVASWDAFLWPYIMTSSPAVQPIEVGLAKFFGGAGVGTEWTVLAAAVMFTTLPIIILFLFMQRQFLAGASSTSAGIKG